MTIDEILEKLKSLKEQRQKALSKGLDTKPWDDDIIKLEAELEKLQ